MSALSEAQVIALAISELTAKPLLFPTAYPGVILTGSILTPLAMP